jgi:hypothetical protein
MVCDPARLGCSPGPAGLVRDHVGAIVDVRIMRHAVSRALPDVTIAFPACGRAAYQANRNRLWTLGTGTQQRELNELTNVKLHWLWRTQAPTRGTCQRAGGATRTPESTEKFVDRPLVFGSTRVTRRGCPKVRRSDILGAIEGFLRLRSLLPRRSSPGLFLLQHCGALWAKIVIVNESRGDKGRG